MPKVSEARFSGNKVTDSSAKASRFRFARKFLERITDRSENKKEMVRNEINIGRRAALGKVLVGILAGTAAVAAPSLLRADDRVARAEVSNEKGVQYETFSDPKELEPYFDNAKDKLVSIKPGEVKRIGEFDVWIKPCAEDPKNEFGTEFRLRDGNGKEHKVLRATALSEINILELDLGNHPYFKGKIVIFADEQGVVGVYKTDKGYITGAVSARSGKMREGPIRTGIEMDGDTLILICSPRYLQEGDVVYQAQIDREGKGGAYFYKYTTSRPEGTMVASL